MVLVKVGAGFVRQCGWYRGVRLPVPLVGRVFCWEDPWVPKCCSLTIATLENFAAASSEWRTTVWRWTAPSFMHEAVGRWRTAAACAGMEERLKWSRLRSVETSSTTPWTDRCPLLTKTSAEKSTGTIATR